MNLKIEEYIKKLPWLFTKVCTLEEVVANIDNGGDPDPPSTSIVNYTVTNFSGLSALSPSIFEIAYVENSQGTQYLPGPLGGTYYPKGLYYWNGSAWVNDKNGIYQGLENITNSLAALSTVANSGDYNDLSNLPTDLVRNNLTGEPAGSQSILKTISLTQAQYDASTPLAGTFYAITDA